MSNRGDGPPSKLPRALRPHAAPPSPTEERGDQRTLRSTEAPLVPAEFPPTPGPSLEIGTVLNRNYEITGLVKSGGMGQVYRGRTLGNGVPVAIKTVLPEHAGVAALSDLFRQESAILVRLSVDGIVRYFNYIYDEENRRGFLIMEFIEGETLSEFLLDHGPLDVAPAVHLFRRLASALARAHAEGIIHRDLSPDNVMLRGHDIAAPVLIDFGIAKSDDHSDMTVGVGAGKYAFMAPEQLGMYRVASGPWTDVYGLGLLIAAASQGRALDMGANPSEAVEARRAAPVLEAVPESLRPLLREMLAPDPKARPQDMAEVLARLPADGAPPLEIPAPVPKGPANTGLRMRPDAAQLRAAAVPVAPQAKRRRTGPWAAVAVLIALGGVAAWRPWAAPPTPAPPRPEIAGPPALEALFAGADLGPCRYARMGTDGATAGLAELYGDGPGGTGALRAALTAEASAAPQVVERPVQSAQCPVLDGLRALQAQSAVPIALSVELSEEASGLVTVSGTVADSLGRAVWLGFVLPDGAVNPVAPSRVVQGDGAARFSEQFSVFVRGAPVLVLALATPEPLARLAGPATRDAAEVMALFGSRLSGPEAASQAAGRVGYLFLPE